MGIWSTNDNRGGKRRSKLRNKNGINSLSTILLLQEDTLKGFVWKGR